MGIKRPFVMAFLSFTLASAACASQKAEEPKAGPADPDVVVLAHFVAEADPGTGRIQFTVEPTPLGKAMGTNLVIPDTTGAVMHSNPGWVNDGGENGYCGATSTWGAQVWATSAYAYPSYVGGVYAQVTDFTSGGGNTPCNGLLATAAPVGVDATKGLWYQGTAGVAGDSSSTPWAFNYVSATPFTFYGRVLGVKLSYFPPPSGFGANGAIKGNGATMVFPANTGMGFLDSTGTTSRVELTVGSAIAVAPDVANGRIWYVNYYAGVTNSAGTEISDYVYMDGVAGFDIVRDTSDANAAWVLSYWNGGFPYYLFQKVVFSAGTIAKSGAAIYRYNKVPLGVVALGSNLYVTESTLSTTGTSTIAVWDTTTWNGTDGTMTVTEIVIPAGNCRGVYDNLYGHVGGKIMVAPDGLSLWYTGSQAVCSIAGPVGGTSGAVLDPLPGNELALNLCIGSDGRAWFLRTSGLVRYLAGTGSSPTWIVDVSGNINQPRSSCAAGPSGFWAWRGQDTEFLKIEP